MRPEFAGRRALITGASRGIGRAIAAHLAMLGCRVAINGRDGEQLAAAANEIPGSIAVPGDMTDQIEARHAVTAAVDALGGLDVLVCNVGSGRSVVPGDESLAEWQRVFATNLWSATNAVEAARPMLAASRGTIVCISSICGIEVVPGAPVTYSAAKAALNAYVRGIARPLGRQGIRINAIAPGNILFEGSTWDRKLKEDPEAVRDVLAQHVALGRLGTPQEVAELAAFLASPHAGFATGAVWTLDGGQLHA